MGAVMSVARLANRFSNHSAEAAAISQWSSGKFCCNQIALAISSTIELVLSALPVSLLVSGVQHIMVLG
jgi:hypothetical protein